MKDEIDLRCRFCKNILKNGNSLHQHEIRCKLNPNKIRTSLTEETKKKLSGIMKIKNTNSTRILNQETLDLMSKKSKEMNKKLWTKEYREQHSILMNKVIKEKPDSYSKNNVSGRAKIYEYKNTKLKGTWELLIAEKLDENNIKWTNDITPIPYFWNGKNHLYFPDFFLEDYNMFIEVKGYETERDQCKWKSVNIPLVILRESEIKSIKNNSKNIIEFIK